MFFVRYLHPQPVFATAELQIRGLGIRETLPRCFVSRPQGTGDYLLMLFHDEVEIQWESDGPVHELSPGTMVIWPRGAAHFYGNRKQRWSHSWVHCDGRAVGEALEISPNACRCPLVLFNPSRIERYLWDLNEEIQGPRPAEPVIVRHTLLNIIFEAARLPGTHPHRVAPELLHIRNVMDVRYDEKLDLTLLAREIHWSAPHLCSEFRRCFGVPPITYLIHRRLEAAASMLRNTPLSIGEVGRRVGYDDVYHFSKSFKQFHGQPPTRYRTQVMNPKTEARGAV